MYSTLKKKKKHTKVSEKRHLIQFLSFTEYILRTPNNYTPRKFYWIISMSEVSLIFVTQGLMGREIFPKNQESN